jgi:hypothetical protein
MADDPKDYVVTVKATVRPLKDKTLVLLDLAIDSPKYRRAGIEPARHAPPIAVRLASAKFWGQLGNQLREVKAPSPRRRAKQEIDA